MTGHGSVRASESTASSLDRVRSLEAVIEQRRADREAVDAVVAEARTDAERLRDAARRRGEAAARRHREECLAEVERKAAELRTAADDAAGRLRAAAERHRSEIAAALAATVLPGAGA